MGCVDKTRSEPRSVPPGTSLARSTPGTGVPRLHDHLSLLFGTFGCSYIAVTRFLFMSYEREHPIPSGPSPPTNQPPLPYPFPTIKHLTRPFRKDSSTVTSSRDFLRLPLGTITDPLLVRSATLVVHVSGVPSSHGPCFCRVFRSVNFVSLLLVSCLPDPSVCSPHPGGSDNTPVTATLDGTSTLRGCPKSRHCTLITTNVPVRRRFASSLSPRPHQP